MSKTNSSSMLEIQKLVQNKIASKKVMIFVKTTCPHCKRVKKLFQQLMDADDLKPEDYEEMDIGRHPDGYKIQNYLGRITGAKTSLDSRTIVRVRAVKKKIRAVFSRNLQIILRVPRVFINGKSIGGADDTEKIRDNGSLKQKLHEKK